MHSEKLKFFTKTNDKPQKCRYRANITKLNLKYKQKDKFSNGITVSYLAYIFYNIKFFTIFCYLALIFRITFMTFYISIEMYQIVLIDNAQMQQSC